eukprot:TRINITY_DN24534_c0_g1_i1.p1 TRINITY_DN24534_c0_g1~~TRINITY_DN24534_c0_g1_i1.p1  ORF type:complete len:168 (-),score=62.50 TRINITY_DN24534_c0_g1_i1:39-542(-)
MSTFSVALFFFFFFKQKTAYEMLRSLVGSEMCIRDSNQHHNGRNAGRHGSPSSSSHGLDPLHVSSQQCTNRDSGHGAFWDPIFAHFTNNIHQGGSSNTTTTVSTPSVMSTTSANNNNINTSSSPYYTSPSARMLANDATTLVKTVRERSFTGENFVDLLSLQLPGSD